MCAIKSPYATMAAAGTTFPARAAEADFTMDESHASQTITDDIQGSAVVHQFIVMGNPFEAAASQGFGNLLPGDLHPVFNHHYLEQLIASTCPIDNLLIPENPFPFA